MVTQVVSLGSLNARGLVAVQHSKTGTALGCPRLTVIDLRLRSLYQASLQKNHAQHARALALLKLLQEQYVIEHESLLAFSAEVRSLVDPNDFLQPSSSEAKPITISLQHPLSWNGLRLIKLYDELMMVIQFLFSTGGLKSTEPQVHVRKLRERAGRPVRSFLTQVSKELAHAGFSS